MNCWTQREHCEVVLVTEIAAEPALASCARLWKYS